ncbi:HNH endonuclease [Sinorhizobium meliloti]|nr:HNH endonuclease [Sinorhizobium meliloti]
MTIHLNQYPALVLNADFTPKSVFPLSTLNWQDAAKGVFLGKYVRVVDYDASIKTRTQEYVLPSVVAMKDYVQVKNGVAFSRHNIWIRDEGKCAYCREALKMNEFTFDHVVPQMLGGRTEWTNIVCACQPCNGKKAAKSVKTAGLTLYVTPHTPTVYEIAAKARRLGGIGPTPEQWIDFLYWETELER